MALLLNRQLRGRAVLRHAVFVPYVLSEVIDRRRVAAHPAAATGRSTALLQAVGLGGLDPAAGWPDPDIVLYTLFVVITWKYIGFAIILFLAGLQGIPDELSEAAAIDGASWWQIQRHITLPLLGPTIRIWVFLSIIGSLQLFDVSGS